MTETGAQTSTSTFRGPFHDWSEPRSLEAHVSALVAALSVRTIGAETVRASDALDRALVDDLHAPFDLPRFDNSQMDGFALDATSTPGSFDVGAMIPAGHTGEPVPQGTAVPIMTGAPIPPGANAVVPVEATEGYDSPFIRVDETRAGEFVRPRGSDITAGDVAFPAGTALRSAGLGVLAAFGLTEIAVRARPRVLIVTGGDEVAAPGERLRADQVFDTNSALLSAVLRRCGAVVVEAIVVDDSVDDFRAALGERVRAVDPDLVVTSGGISAGRFEVVQQGLAPGGDLDGFTPVVGFGPVAMQPGGPQGLGVLRDEDGDSIPIVCFPGNPVSTWVSAHVLLRDALARAWRTGRPARKVTAALVDPVMPLPTRTQLRRADLDVGLLSDGSIDSESTQLRVRAFAGTGSHLLATAARADSLIVVPPGSGELPAGTPVEVVLL